MRAVALASTPSGSSTWERTSSGSMSVLRCSPTHATGSGTVHHSSRQTSANRCRSRPTPSTASSVRSRSGTYVTGGRLARSSPAFSNPVASSCSRRDTPVSSFPSGPTIRVPTTSKSNAARKSGRSTCRTTAAHSVRSSLHSRRRVSTRQYRRTTVDRGVRKTAPERYETESRHPVFLCVRALNE